MENKLFLAPSMMCANFEHLGDEIRNLNKTKIASYHIDIMDGDFVPNFGMGLQDLETISKLSEKMIDVHLMVQNPKDHIELFANLGANIIYFHPETDAHPIRTLENIKKRGVKPGIAISTQTPVESIRHLLPYVDYVLLMSVVPGFAGQQFLEIVEEKVKELLEYKNHYSFKTVMDGAITEAVIQKYAPLGVEGYVLGTSSLFGKEKSFDEIINQILRANNFDEVA